MPLVLHCEMKVWGGEVVPLQSIGDENYPTVDHVPFGERKVVDIVRDEAVLCNAEGLEHRLLPVATATFNGGEGINDAEG